MYGNMDSLDELWFQQTQKPLQRQNLYYEPNYETADRYDSAMNAQSRSQQAEAQALMQLYDPRVKRQPMSRQFRYPSHERLRPEPRMVEYPQQQYARNDDQSRMSFAPANGYEVVQSGNYRRNDSQSPYDPNNDGVSVMSQPMRGSVRRQRRPVSERNLGYGSQQLPPQQSQHYDTPEDVSYPPINAQAFQYAEPVLSRRFSNNRFLLANEPVPQPLPETIFSPAQDPAYNTPSFNINPSYPRVRDSRSSKPVAPRHVGPIRVIPRNNLGVEMLPRGSLDRMRIRALAEEEEDPLKGHRKHPAIMESLSAIKPIGRAVQYGKPNHRARYIRSEELRNNYAQHLYGQSQAVKSKRRKAFNRLLGHIWAWIYPALLYKDSVNRATLRRKAFLGYLSEHYDLFTKATVDALIKNPLKDLLAIIANDPETAGILKDPRRNWKDPHIQPSVIRFLKTCNQIFKVLNTSLDLHPPTEDVLYFLGAISMDGCFPIPKFLFDYEITRLQFSVFGALRNGKLLASFIYWTGMQWISSITTPGVDNRHEILKNFEHPIARRGKIQGQGLPSTPTNSAPGSKLELIDDLFALEETYIDVIVHKIEIMDIERNMQAFIERVYNQSKFHWNQNRMINLHMIERAQVQMAPRYN